MSGRNPALREGRGNILNNKMKFFKKIIKRLFKKFKKGFSLVEILVVLSICSVFAGTTASFMHQYQPTLKLKGEVKKLMSELRYAQQLTLTEQIVHCLRFSPIENKYRLIRNPGSHETVPAEIILAELIRFQEVTFLNNEICFNFAGGSSETGEITLSNGERTTTIKVRPSGYVRMYEDLVPPS